MDKIESNALKIAELKGWKFDYTDWEGNDRYSKNGSPSESKYWLITVYSSYNVLMQIIESEISEYELKAIHFELKTDSLLEAVQNFVIRYLELKNGLWN